MKIEDLLLLTRNLPTSPATKGNRDDFAECLAEALALKKDESKAQPLSGAAAVNGVVEGDPAKAAQEMVETVLSRLEIFQEGLTRPGLALKALAPLVQALEADSQRLLSLSQVLPSDSPLRQVVEEVAALTWTESFKFARGDYL
jgi:hypothetical protein